MSFVKLMAMMLPSCIFFIWGGWQLARYFLRKQREKHCTAPVTGEIIAVKIKKLRRATHYRYTVRYYWEGEAHTADFRTMNDVGGMGDELEVYTDPAHPQYMFSNVEDLQGYADLLLGIALIVIGVFCVVAELGWNP